MRVHHLQHDSAEGLGSLEAWFRGRGDGVRTSALHRGDALPAVDDFDWLVVMGGPMSVNDAARYPWLVEETRLIADAIAAHRTVVGVCLGSQLVAAALGARVYRAPEREVGWFPVERTPEGAAHPLGTALPERFLAFQWHECAWRAVPPVRIRHSWPAIVCSPCSSIPRCGSTARGR
jgi:GMP synthase-like glutamine amidotransferase